MGLAAAVAHAADASGAPPVRISAKDFGALPFIGSPTLSPDGTKALTTIYAKGVRKLAIIDLAASNAITHTVEVAEHRDLLALRWAGNERVVFTVGGSIDMGFGKLYATRLQLLDLTTNKLSFLNDGRLALLDDEIIYIDPEGRYLLLATEVSAFQYPSVWRVDLDTLKKTKLLKSHDGIVRWFADARGTVRAGLGINGYHWWLIYRPGESDGFKKVLSRKFGAEQEGTIDRFIPSAGSDTGFVISDHKTGRYGLYRYDFATNTLGEPIFEHPEVDIDDVLLSPAGSLEAVLYTDDRQRIEWLNPRMKTVQATLDKALPGRINRVISMSADSNRMLVWTGSASDPGEFYDYQVSVQRLSLLAAPYDGLEGRTLAEVSSVHYSARDGLQIPAYLTLPPGREPKSLPLIVMPHGGPFARDKWEYDVWVQFLANRGYAVLQPNFRGSTGYGKAYVDKGVGQWGRGMQDDLDDGVKWLVDQGKVDPKRVCMMGASYGGYAALWAAVRNPQTYRCAISLAGVSDVGEMLKYSQGMFSARRYYTAWRKTVAGDKHFDPRSISPLQAVDKISIPLLIAHGDHDEIVPVSQSQQLHDALTKAGKPHEYVVYPGEGHGFEQPEDATNFLERVEVFLDKNNPAD